ncbi:MAG: DUF167 domain-containing protein [Bacteroidota bacterium]
MKITRFAQTDFHPLFPTASLIFKDFIVGRVLCLLSKLNSFLYRTDVKVIPNARKNEIIREDDRLKVKVCAPATDGNANKAVIRALATYFGVKERHITIVKGEKSREKRIRIEP